MSDIPSSRYDTRQTLLRRIRSHEEQGWLEFYEKYSPLIRWLCRRKGMDDLDLIRLVIQSVMLHFAKQDWSYDDNRGRFRNLLLKVAELKIHEVRRECQATPGGGESSLEKVADPASPLELAGRREQLERALLLLCDNPDTNHQHLWVFTQLLEGRSYESLIADSGLSLQNLKVIKHRMLQRLRDILEQEGGE